jgi:LAO/AO transport system kinase
MNQHSESTRRGELILAQLKDALELLQQGDRLEGVEMYTSYLHGQIYGLATALKLLFPGPGNLGEKAALALRPLITEHSCGCDDQDGK